MKRWVLIGVVTLVAAGLLAIIGAGVFVYSGVYDIAASRPHSSLERALLTTVKRRSVEVHAAGIEPPPLDDAVLIQRGLVLYREHCLMCHGAPGEGKSRVGVGMNPNPPPLESALRNWQPAEIFWIIEHGLKMAGMPAFGLGESPHDSWALTAFVVRMNTLTPTAYANMVASLATDAAPATAAAPIDWVGGRDPGWAALFALGEAEEGKRLIYELGCGSCHAVPGVPGARGRIAPPLGEWARRHYLAGRALNRPRDLVPWIVDPQVVKPGTAMPSVGASEAEAWHIARYLYSLE